MVVEASDGSNIHKIFMFVKNESISNMLEIGAIDNLVLMSVFEFVKNVGEFEQHYLILYVLTILCLKKLFVAYGILMYFIFIYRLAILTRLVFCPKFVNFW